VQWLRPINLIILAIQEVETGDWEIKVQGQPRQKVCGSPF
jgi:hypothetical protein